MCRLASVVALRITRPPMAPSSGQSTFCSSRRSIPPRTVMEKSLAADVEARDLLEKDRVVDRARDRRGHGAAVASTLDEHHDHDLGIPHRRERGEPGVVLDRKSTRLNSSHSSISYAVFCLKKKKKH